MLLFISTKAVPASFNSEKLRHKNPHIPQFQAFTCYAVLEKQPLLQEQEKVLTDLLQLGNVQQITSKKQIIYYVFPRPGTKSPFASKAEDILQQIHIPSIERIEEGVALYFCDKPLTQVLSSFYDPMLQQIYTQEAQDGIALENLFSTAETRPLHHMPLIEQGKNVLVAANQQLGLALDADEIDYLDKAYNQLGRNPTDAELMMFAQINSEHCRHKIFNARWMIDGQEQPLSLFEMIKHTYQQNPQGVISAYKDNAAIMEAHQIHHFAPIHNPSELAAEAFTKEPDNSDNSLHSLIYQYRPETVGLMLKVETHNHPTAISPFPGAATGTGGEIRDEAATGRGGKSKAGMVGLMVSHLRIPEHRQSWENPDHGKPSHISSALDIMLQAPIGAARFGNEFGRPNIAGFFRTFEWHDPLSQTYYGYHKPLMIAGGMGYVKAQHWHKQAFTQAASLVVLGGPAMLIGLGGGASSSKFSSASTSQLDFASVQRGNPEMQRRCQEVINQCTEMASNPILFIHDVGAGGLSNAFPELVHDNHLGGTFDLNAIPTDDPSLSPMELWCNEAQERYVLAIDEAQLESFKNLCVRERCPYAVVGYATSEENIVLADQSEKTRAIDLPLSLLFANTPRKLIEVQRTDHPCQPSNFSIHLEEALNRILQLPCVADKSFLITIADRSVGGMVAREPMVGPWQIPVADAGITLADYTGYKGEVIAIGERTPIATLNAAASGRMAIGELITNIASAPIKRLDQIKLSANWMAAMNSASSAIELYDTVRAVALELCPALGLCIPVGKDSLSMQVKWQDETDQRNKQVSSPLSLIITGTAPLEDVRNALTPVLSLTEPSLLLLLDLGKGQNRLGGSALMQIYQQSGSISPDLDDPQCIQRFFQAIQQLRQQHYIQAYHDRSDGGLWVTLLEMAFAGQCGLEINLSELAQSPQDLLNVLFNEELGAVIQISQTNYPAVQKLLADYQLHDLCHPVAQPTTEQQITIHYQNSLIVQQSLQHYQQSWSETSYKMYRLRDHTACAEQQWQNLQTNNQPKLRYDLNDDLSYPIEAPAFIGNSKPRVAILREQGVNGQVEMAAAFTRAGFIAEDVHMSDLIDRQHHLAAYHGLVLGGGFSYGDVFGAGQGWAKSINYHPKLADMFHKFFAKTSSFTLGICNGCQALSYLGNLMPGNPQWPAFMVNQSQQFESRLVMVEIAPSPSIFLTGMAGSKLPVIVAHGEGRIAQPINGTYHACLRYIDNQDQPTERYPFNPNGSIGGITGLTSQDGRITLMMPHPERLFRRILNTWEDHRNLNQTTEDGAWMQMFYNARKWVE